MFGLAGEDTQQVGSLAAALLEPFRHAWGSIRSRFQAPVGKPLEL